MTVEHVSVTNLAKALGKVPVELRRELRPKLRQAAEHVVTDMKGRASYSSRIPGAIGMTVSFSGRGRGGGVRIKVNSRRAPHARVLERGNDGSRSSTFRHPVFGHLSTWVSQNTRPFFFPAVQAGRDDVKRRISEAVRSSIKL